MTNSIIWTRASLATGLMLALVLGSAAEVAGAQARPVKRKIRSDGSPGIMTVEVEDVTGLEAMYSVRSDLRQLLVAQESYWRSRGSYADDISNLPSFHATPGVEIQIVEARPEGWAAKASYGGAVGESRSCSIWVGAVGADDRPATDAERKVYPEAEVSCDGDGYTQRTEWVAAGRSFMTYALRQLARSEARYFAFHGRYTDNAAELDPFVWDNGVTVAISSASSIGWAARASFSAAPGKSCMLWHGKPDAAHTPAPGGAASPPDPDKVVCD